jgi:hypothetical protein
VRCNENLLISSTQSATQFTSSKLLISSAQSATQFALSHCISSKEGSGTAFSPMEKEARGVASLLGEEVSVDGDSGWRWLTAELLQRTTLLVFSSNGRRGRQLRSCARNKGVRRQAKPVPKKKDDGRAPHRRPGGAGRDGRGHGRGAGRRSRARTWAWGQVVEEDRSADVDLAAERRLGRGRGEPGASA